ncbi:MAG: hypothetical protein AUH66_02525 [Acidobacteria bacterium 13_1_40CM_4_57_6]|nr:MAG: hypothetical protein AUH66_02525 [Acidobacteria bacterium 13_1_40CM_4_57_6]
MTRQTRGWPLQGGWVLGMALALAGFVAAGCDDSGNPFVVSLRPFYTKVDLEADPGLTGSWRDKEGDVSFTFQEGEEKEYTLVVKEREGDQETSGEFEAHLLRLGGSWFIDFFPKNNNGEDEFHRVHFFRGHSIARVELGQDSMQMAFLSASWLRARIDEKSIDTPHEKADGSLLLTGTTEEVQELANLYANDETAFADPLSLERTRVEEDVP